MTYRTLDTDRDESWLLSLLKTNNDDESNIAVNLQYASLINPPHYTALSYTWGDPNVTQTILLNGKDHEAITNLDAALRQVRRQLQETKRSGSGWMRSVSTNKIWTREASKFFE